MFFFVNKKEPKKLCPLVEIPPVRLQSPGTWERRHTGPATAGDKVFLLLFVHKKKSSFFAAAD
jgi:hypothetical protein